MLSTRLNVTGSWKFGIFGDIAIVTDRTKAQFTRVHPLDDPLLPPSPSEGRRYWRAAIAWLFLGAALRAGLSFLLPLLPDETYYWDWSRRLEAGYYDHPPGIALLLAAGTKLFGNTLLGIRIGPWLAGGVAHLALTLLGAHLGGPRAAARAAALCALVPAISLSFVLATPDAPLLAFVSLASLLVVNAIMSRSSSFTSLFWWLLTGLAMGAAMVSKYTGVFFPGALLLGLLIHPGLRKLLKSPGPWLSLIVAAVVFAPVVVWNWYHRWLSFGFQVNHGFSPKRGSQLLRELELLGGQMGFVSPILFVILVIVLGSALKAGWSPRLRLSPSDILARRWLLAFLAVAPVLVFVYSAWQRSVEANWPLPLYPTAIALLAAATVSVAWGRWYKVGLWLAGMLTAGVALVAWKPVLPIDPSRDPVGRAYGWDKLASVVDSARREPFLDGSVNVWVAGNIYQDVSQLAFHLPERPGVFSLNLAVRRNQYDLWETASDRMNTGDALVVVLEANAKGDSLATVIGKAFRDYRLHRTVDMMRDDGVVARRKVWLYRIAVDPRLLQSKSAR